MVQLEPLPISPLHARVLLAKATARYLISRAGDTAVRKLTHFVLVPLRRAPLQFIPLPPPASPVPFKVLLNHLRLLEQGAAVAATTEEAVAVEAVALDEDQPSLLMLLDREMA